MANVLPKKDIPKLEEWYKQYPNFQYVQEKFAAYLGIFGVFFGHKVDAYKKRKLHAGHLYILDKYYAGQR